MNADVLIKKWEGYLSNLEWCKENTEHHFKDREIFIKGFISDLKELKEQQAERNELKEKQSGKGWDDIFLEYSKACSLELEAVKYILPLKDWLNKTYPQKSDAGKVLQAEQPYNLEDSIKKASENWREIDPDKFLSEIRG